MKYETIGQIKSVNLTSHTFTLEPISSYRFKPTEDSESYLIMLRETSVADGKLSKLDLVPFDALFSFSKNLSSAVVMLKQNRTKIQVGVDSIETSKVGNVINRGNPVQIVLL